MFKAVDKPCAKLSPIKRAPNNPGPLVYAILSMLSKGISSSALLSTSTIFEQWSRDASSGTTPQYSACISI